MKQIKKDIYAIPMLNPNMRVFDIIMKTEYGTSYNSYLIKSQKNVLIDTCHNSYTKQFLIKIQDLIDIKNLNYIVVNHCEPDHTGSLIELIKLNPNIEIVCTQASSINLQNLFKGLKLNFKVVKYDDELDLGNNKVLQFKIAPFLHWPDSMFTYLKNEQIIFTCDFLGSHYCEPNFYDKDIKNINQYHSAIENYYYAIFHPFIPYVIKGLEIIKNLNIDTVCPSHGPILTKGSQLEYVIKCYSNWSNIVIDDNLIPIIYASSYGYTKQIAEEIQKTINNEKPNMKTKMFDINVTTALNEVVALINKSSRFIIGSPTINHNAVEPIWNVLLNLSIGLPSKVKVLVFGDYGWSGEATQLIQNYLKSIKINVFDEIIKVKFSISSEDKKHIEETTKKFINLI